MILEFNKECTQDVIFISLADLSFKYQVNTNNQTSIRCYQQEQILISLHPSSYWIQSFLSQLLIVKKPSKLPIFKYLSILYDPNSKSQNVQSLQIYQGFQSAFKLCECLVQISQVYLLDCTYFIIKQVQQLMDSTESNSLNKTKHLTYSTEADENGLGTEHLRSKYLRRYERFLGLAPLPKTNEPSTILEGDLSFAKLSSLQLQTQREIFNQELIVENQLLKEKLCDSELLAEKLQLELRICKEELEKATALGNYEFMNNEGVILQLREEIKQILEKSTVLQKEVEEGRKLLKESQQQAAKERTSLVKETNAVGRKSLDKDVGRWNDILQECNTLSNRKENRDFMSFTARGKLQGDSMQWDFPNSQGKKDFSEMGQNTWKKSDELLNSIKGMYTKISGKQVSSLKELWRWLKNIGQVFNILKRWKAKTRQTLMNPNELNTQTLQQILTQAMDSIE